MISARFINYFRNLIQGPRVFNPFANLAGTISVTPVFFHGRVIAAQVIFCMTESRSRNYRSFINSMNKKRYKNHGR